MRSWKRSADEGEQDSNKDGTPDYARYRKHFVDVSNQIGGGSASDPSKPFLHGCSKCQKLGPSRNGVLFHPGADPCSIQRSLASQNTRSV